MNRTAGCANTSDYAGDIDALDPDAVYEALYEPAEDVNPRSTRTPY